MKKINLIFEKKRKRYFLKLYVKSYSELIIYLNELISNNAILISIEKNDFKI